MAWWTKQQRKADVRRRRLILMHALGCVCEQCGCDDVGRLEFHHKQPRTWIAAELSDTTRQRMYEKDYVAGKLGLLCSTCNKKSPPPADENDLPF